MRWTIVLAFALLSATPAWCDDVLPARSLTPMFSALPDCDYVNFDIMDMRAAAEAPAPRVDVTPHSMFGIKQHLGVAVGYDNGELHSSLGLYLTVAEWGRWNFGVVSPALGFGRYSVYDVQRKQSIMKNESTLFISLASVHYRMGYLPSLGFNWYINLEQIFDVQQNTTGSQIGITLSRK